MIRYQLPVRSPLSLDAIWNGVRAMTNTKRGRDAAAGVSAALEAHLGQTESLFVDSGTSALGISLRALDASTRRPVAIPAFACYDVATAVNAAGAPFILYDVDPITLSPDPHSLRSALALGADRVVVVHLFGVPADLRAVEALSREYDALVIEDAAQGAGASFNHQSVGSRSPLTVLSFGRGKGLTGGNGGALLGHGETARRLIERSRSELGRATGSSRDLVALLAQWFLSRPVVYGLPASLPFLRLGETIHHPTHRPSGISDLALGVLERTLTLSAAELAIRRKNAARLLTALERTGFVNIVPASGGVPGYLRLPVLAPGPMLGVVDSVAARRLGIMRSYPRSLADLPGFGERRVNASERFPGAVCLATELLTFPVHGAMSTRDLDAIERWIDAVDT